MPTNKQMLIVSGQKSLRSNLVAYWKLNETSTSAVAVTRADATGRGNTLEDVLNSASRAGVIGNGVDLVLATGNFLRLTTAPDMTMGDIDFTLAGWFIFDDLAADRVMCSKWGGATNEYMLFYKSSTQRLVWRILVNTTEYNVSANNLGVPSTGTPYFVVVWHDSVLNSTNIQVNNGTVDTLAHTLGCNSSTGSFRLGNGAGVKYDGLIDEFGVWKRTLNADERTRLYNGGSGRTYPF